MESFLYINLLSSHTSYIDLEESYKVLKEKLSHIKTFRVGFHIYQLELCVSCSVVWLFVTPCTVASQAPRPWNSPGKNTGMGCHALLQVILQSKGSNPGLPHCRQILYHLSHQGSLGISYNWAGSNQNSLGVLHIQNLVRLLQRTVGALLCSAYFLSCVWLFVTPWTVATRLLYPWDSPGKNTGVGYHAPPSPTPRRSFKPRDQT